MPYFLTVDIGGTVIKSGLYDGHGREKAVASQTDLAIVKHVGWSERDMIAMWRTVCATVREVLATAGISAHDVAGVSFSAHGKGLYLVDADGAPVRNGIISSDNRVCPSYGDGSPRAWTPRPIPAATSSSGRAIRFPCSPGSRSASRKTTGASAMF